MQGGVVHSYVHVELVFAVVREDDVRQLVAANVIAVLRATVGCDVDPVNGISGPPQPADLACEVVR